MKYIFILFFFSFSSLAAATDYYISSSGNDSNSGLSVAAPWKTITKVNTAFSILLPGDRILFRRGDVFYGTLVITKSGVAGAPITIGAYGTGAQPLITGFTTLSSWSYAGNGRYSAPVSSVSQTNMVIVDGVQIAMGRYPDTGTNLTYTTASANSITDPEIGTGTNWTGAEIAINKNDWTLDRCKVTDHVGNVLTYSNRGSVQTPFANRYYFIQNDLRCLTAKNEWYHDASAGRFYIYDDPSTKTVKVATLNYLIYNAAFDYITIDGLNLQGSIDNAIYCASITNNWIIKNCLIEFAGYAGIYFAGGNNGLIDNNIISSCNVSGVYAILYYCNIINNNVSDIGMLPGQSFLYHPVGIYICGSDFFMQYNDISNTGWSGIQSASNTTFIIKNNLIDYTCQILDDGGGIYFNGSDATLRTIEGNIVLNCGVGGTDNNLTRGIFLDGAASNISVKDNTAAHCFKEGIICFGGTNNTFTGNTSYDNSSAMFFQQYSTAKIITGTTIKDNIFFAKESTQNALRFLTLTNNLKDFGIADNNYYVRPIKDDEVFAIYEPSTGSKNLTLDQWKLYTAQDANSKKSLVSVTKVEDIRFEFNASKTNKTVTLEKPMMDVRGNKYQESITLLPYTSAVLMLDPDAPSNAVPEYMSSIIENITPTTLEMTYDLTMANVIPDVTSFRVLVNSVARNVTDVTISGSKVRLTLADPPSFGDLVSLSYTKPAANPLQSVSGVLAVSISSRPVTNTVNTLRPIPVSITVENGAPGIIKMEFNMILASLVPPATAFTVVVNSIARVVNSVSLSGTDVILILSSPVESGDVVTVAYSTPSINALRSTSGWKVISFGAQSVTNEIEELRPLFMGASVEANTPAILEMTYSMDLANIVPPASAFTVKVNSIQRAVNTVTITGTKVYLTLSNTIVTGDDIVVSYTTPSTNALRSSAGWYVLSFGSQPVTNNVSSDSIRPVLINSTMENSTSSILTMTFSLNLSTVYIPSASAFTVMVNSVQRTVNAVSISETDVTLTLASSIASGDVITVAYTIPTTNALRSSAGWYVLSFGAQPVTNNVSSDSVRPVLINSTVENSTPSILTMTLSLNLSNTYVPPASAFTVMVNSLQRTVSSVAISGSGVTLTLSSPVISGDVITVAYAIPSANALRSVPGWYVLSFGAQPVTNNVTSIRPVLISAAVEFTTPATLDMVFSLTLSSGYIPPVTSFTVFVNSVRRTVNSVSISGTRVQLALASKVVYRDVVTVAYTISSVALRSVPGWYVLSFTSQPVANKCLATSSLVSHKSSDTEIVNKISADSEIENTDFLSTSTGRITLFPNPATYHVNIYLPEPSDKVNLLRIYDYTGRMCMEIRIEPEVHNLHIPLNLGSGNYILKVSEGNKTIFTKKLVILN